MQLPMSELLYLDGLEGISRVQRSERGKIRIPRAVATLGLLIPISSHHLSSSVDDDSALHHPNKALQILASRGLEEFLFGLLSVPNCGTCHYTDYAAPSPDVNSY